MSLTRMVNYTKKDPSAPCPKTSDPFNSVISRLLATALKVQFSVRFPLSNTADKKYSKNRRKTPRQFGNKRRGRFFLCFCAFVFIGKGAVTGIEKMQGIMEFK